MAARVAIGAGLFKVSKPGFDAGSAGPGGLLFDSATAKLNGVYQRGVLGAGAFTETTSAGPPYITTRTAVLSYDSANYPRLFFVTQNGLGNIRPVVAYTDIINGEPGPTNITSINRAWMYATAQNISGGTRFTVTSYYTTSAAASEYERNISILYVVLY